MEHRFGGLGEVLGRDAIVHNVLDRVRPGAIIVFHDSDETDKADRSPTIAALNIILPALKAAGYRLVTVSEPSVGSMLAKPAPELEKNP